MHGSMGGGRKPDQSGSHRRTAQAPPAYPTNLSASSEAFILRFSAIVVLLLRRSLRGPTILRLPVTGLLLDQRSESRYTTCTGLTRRWPVPGIGDPPHHVERLMTDPQHQYVLRRLTPAVARGRACALRGPCRRTSGPYSTRPVIYQSAPRPKRQRRGDWSDGQRFSGFQRPSTQLNVRLEIVALRWPLG